MLVLVIELLDRSLSLLAVHGPVESYEAELGLLKGCLEEVEEASELREDDRMELWLGEFDVDQMVDDRLDLGARCEVALLQPVLHTLSATS